MWTWSNGNSDLMIHTEKVGNNYNREVERKHKNTTWIRLMIRLSWRFYQQSIGLWNQQKHQSRHQPKGRNQGRKAEGYQTTETKAVSEDDLFKKFMKIALFEYNLQHDSLEEFEKILTLSQRVSYWCQTKICRYTSRSYFVCNSLYK